MGKFHQGKYTVKNKYKYVGDISNVVYRSGWEKKVFLMLDNNSNILKWGSELMPIPYYSKVDQKTRRYYPDVFVKYKDKNGEIITDVIEVKPFKETQPPKKTGGKNSKKRYLSACVTYQRNQDKWESCNEWCKKQGFNFRLMTENEIFK